MLLISFSKLDLDEVARLFGQQFNYLLTTRIQDSNELELLAVVDKIRTAEIDKKISDMLDRVDKLRIINQESRRWHHKKETEEQDLRAVVFISPVPEGMTSQELETFFSVYGIVHKVDCNGSEEASVQFAKVDHAQTAVLALRSSASFTKAFGEHARVWMRDEENAERPNDTWAQDWGSGWSAQQGSWMQKGGSKGSKVGQGKGPNGTYIPLSNEKGGSQNGSDAASRGGAVANGGYASAKGADANGAARQERPQRPTEGAKSGSYTGENGKAAGRPAPDRPDLHATLQGQET